MVKIIRFRAMSGALLLAALAGCGKNDETNVTSVEVPQGNEQARIQAMPEGERNAVFIRAIRDAGLECQNVESSTPQPDIGGQPAWTAHCRGAGDYAIVIGRGGMASVVPPATAAQDGNQAAGQ